MLILGACGGVGTCCVLLAKMAGAEVIACASSAEKIERLKELGADHVIDYTKEDFMKPRSTPLRQAAPARVRGRRRRRDQLHRRRYLGAVAARACSRGGKLLTCGATAGFDPKEDIRYIWSFEIKILGSNGWTRRRSRDAAAHGRGAAGCSPVIDRVLPLVEAREGIRLLEEREVIGKVIVVP